MQQQVSDKRGTDGVLDAFNGRMGEAAAERKIEPTFVDAGFRHSARVRRGAIAGAMLGMIVGLIPMLTAVIFAAIAGALIARASEMHIDRGTKPSVHFGRAV